MAKDGSINSLLTVGRDGSQVMMARAYREISWDDTDFLDNIKVGTMYSLHTYLSSDSIVSFIHDFTMLRKRF